MPAQQHVLNWLYSVLTSEYHDVNRTYNDVATALTRYPSLAPRTDVHTFPNGASALLLHLSGTIPVNFRGNTYRFPISVWVPHAYPREPPLIYVTPTDSMVIRPGQHVDAQGQVYHPYLVGWSEFWDKSTLNDLLAILSDVFAKEPPVIARQQQRQMTLSSDRQQSSPSLHSPPPPNPPNVSNNELRPPPPPPPKTSHELSEDASLPQAPDRWERSASQSLKSTPAPSSTSRYHSAPPLPPEAFTRPTGQQVRPKAEQPGIPSKYSQPIRQNYQTDSMPDPSPQPSAQEPQQQAKAWTLRSTSPRGNAPEQWQPTNEHYQRLTTPHYAPLDDSRQALHRRSAASQQIPDLLDEPLMLNIYEQAAVAPPPIPPNPEKDALLRQLAHILAVQRQQARYQNESSLAGLQAQRSAMLSAIPILQSETSQFTQLSNVLNSNTGILHEALRKADAVIDSSRSHPAPDIDELLVAPTVVANQLYMLVAEERALADAVFMLGRAMERGRISPAVFAKMTRSLAREWYLKKALVRKIGIGMGLSSLR